MLWMTCCLCVELILLKDAGPDMAARVCRLLYFLCSAAPASGCDSNCAPVPDVLFRLWGCLVPCPQVSITDPC